MSATITDVSLILLNGIHACMATLCRMISAILWHLLSKYIYVGLLLEIQCFKDRVVLSRLPILWHSPKSASKSPHMYYIYRSGFNHCLQIRFYHLQCF